MLCVNRSLYYIRELSLNLIYSLKAQVINQLSAPQYSRKSMTSHDISLWWLLNILQLYISGRYVEVLCNDYTDMLFLVTLYTTRLFC